MQSNDETIFGADPTPHRRTEHEVNSEKKARSLRGELIVPSPHPFFPPHHTFRWAALIFSTVLISRLVIIALMYLVTKGHEYTNDAIIWKNLSEDPLQLIAGWGTFEAQYPPLQPLLEALFYRPIQHWLGDFIALRATSAIYEAAGAGLLVILLARLRVNALIGSLVLATLFLNPIGWVTSALWGEDEAMFFTGATAVLLLIYDNRPLAALLLASFAVVAIKIFFLVLLLPMIVFLPWASLPKRAVVAAIPIILVYCVSFVGNLIFLGHINFGLLEFEPDNDFAISFWSAMTVLFHWPPPSIQRPVAGILSLSAGLAICAAVRYRRQSLRFDQLVLLSAVLDDVGPISILSYQSRILYIPISVLLCLSKNNLRFLLLYGAGVCLLGRQLCICHQKQCQFAQSSASKSHCILHGSRADKHQYSSSVDADIVCTFMRSICSKDDVIALAKH